jgi:hypothetical protein
MESEQGYLRGGYWMESNSLTITNMGINVTCKDGCLLGCSAVLELQLELEFIYIPLILLRAKSKDVEHVIIQVHASFHTIYVNLRTFDKSTKTYFTYKYT